MIEQTNDTWVRQNRYGTFVGLYHGAPDTVLMVFQRSSHDNGETLTTTLPMSMEAFRDLIALGQRWVEKMDSKMKEMK